MQALLVVVVVLLALTLVSLWVVIYQIIRQQGRLVLRQDELEGTLSQVPAGSSTNGRCGGQGSSRGLAIGEQVESFSLPDLKGRPVRLKDFRGKKVLLVHWSTSCGFCTQIAPELAELQPDLRKRGVELVLVSRGSAEDHRELAEEYGLEAPIVLLEDGESLEAFSGVGTPAAYLLDKKGKVDHHLAVGANRVPQLAREAARIKKQEVDQEEQKTPLKGEKSLSESRIERDGLKPGTPAPPIRMPDVYGNMVSLESFRGRRVLLVFSAPDCGPCEALAPDLARLHRDHVGNGSVVLMVGQGDLQANRQKAEAYGFDFPVVVQRRWEVSRNYGIFATPVAFLIDEEGVIAASVARGKDEILELAPDMAATRDMAMNGKGSSL